jgi:hypothetical protein
MLKNYIYHYAIIELKLLTTIGKILKLQKIRKHTCQADLT